MLSIPLSYSYKTEIPHWSRFGSIDSRSFVLQFAKYKTDYFGHVLSDNNYEYFLIPDRPFENYAGFAAKMILTDFGVTVTRISPYVLSLYPLEVKIDAASTRDDGEKRCVIKMCVVLKCQETILFNALIENCGKKQFDADDEDDYAELIDMTMHGIFVKLWASRVLFTDAPLGKGVIIKKDLGTYGFVPNALVKELNVPDAALSQVTAPDYASDGGQRPPASGILSETTDNQVSGNRMSGTYAVKDSIVLDDGKRITIGVLPFENATGQEKLGDAVREAREILQVELAKARTVKVMDREKLTEVLQEQALGLTGIMNDSTVVNVGNISGVRAMIAGKLTTTGSYYRLSAKIINVETSAIVVAVSVTSADAHQIADAVPELAAKLLFAFTEEKIEINRNTMSYPSVSPLAVGAVTASVEDAWAVEINPAGLMKVRQKDANFFVSFAKTLSGHLNNYEGPAGKTTQPPFEKMGINVALPIGLRFASGFGIQHQYTYPFFKKTLGTNTYNLKEEETVFTIPFAWGISPKFSVGCNVRSHILEYQIINPGYPYLSGNAFFLDAKIAGLFKISERFKAGMTFKTESFTMKAREKIGAAQQYTVVARDVPNEFRFGTAMYPLKWWFFFADLVYEKQPEEERIQPGFYLGTQFTYTGKLFKLPFLPAYGMIPLFVGYSHEPYNNATGTQAKYFSMGTGYFLNNIYVRWSMRFNAEQGADRKTVVGLPGKNALTLYDYSLTTPLFLCVGYRF